MCPIDALRDEQVIYALKLAYIFYIFWVGGWNRAEEVSLHVSD